MDHAEKITYSIREDAFVARVGAFFLKGKKFAIVLGGTIYLHGASKEELLGSVHWLRHELMHIRQFKEEGFGLFLLKYIGESCRRGYRNNRFEKEARAAENQEGFEKNFKWLVEGGARN